MNKKYIVDTNVLLDDPECITTLYNGSENEIFIPRHVILELDHLKRDNKKRYLVNKVIDKLIEHKDKVTILECKDTCSIFDNRVDEFILKEIFENNDLNNGIFVTNDKLLQLECNTKNIKWENYKSINPFKSESEKYSGFIDINNDEFIYNSFSIIDEQLFFNKDIHDTKLIEFEYEIWKVNPKTIYQNAAFAMMLSDHIDICSIQSSAGLGKTFIALATAFYLVLQKKRYSKIYITKPNVEIGQPLGYLPGDIKEKLSPYIEYLNDLVLKLHDIRPANKIFKNEDKKTYNENIFKILPINFIRGMNIDDAIVIIDETQNLTRMETRTLLSRFGENVKCICLGDTSQVDHPYLNPDNNGLNWIVKLFKNQKNYGHITLQGDKSRGPICDLVLKTGL